MGRRSESEIQLEHGEPSDSWAAGGGAREAENLRSGRRVVSPEGEAKRWWGGLERSVRQWPWPDSSSFVP